jgi:hypothetical protein
MRRKESALLFVLRAEVLTQITAVYARRAATLDRYVLRFER